jgi:hypothetical protein
MFIDSATSEIRTPAGCYVPEFVFGPLMRTRDIAPRWGATRAANPLYKHGTPLGC